MLGNVLFVGAFAFCLMNVNAISLDKVTSIYVSESEEKTETLESLKEFVRLVDKYNLNVSIIGSHNKYGGSGWVKETLSLKINMPVNNEFLTEPTLDDTKQSNYLKKLKELSKKDHVGIGAKVRVIKIEDGTDKLATEHSINPQYLIDSPSYKYMTTYRNGVSGFVIPENETNEILYNYILKEPTSDGVKYVQVVTANVIMNELDVSANFPADVLVEIKQLLPKLYLSLDDKTIFARILSQKLDKKFDGNFQVLIGVDKFALPEKSSYANIQVGDTNVLVFTLP